jgi:hypothetical protein
MDIKNQIKLIELIQRSLSDDISEEGFNKLNEILKRSDEARRHYREILYIYTKLGEHGAVVASAKETVEDVFDETVWMAMARYEQTAPKISPPKEKIQHEMIQRVAYPPRERRRLSKFSIIMLLNAAAIILFFVFLRYAPYKVSTEVATLIDSIDAKWADSEISTFAGTRLCDNETLQLLKGVVKIQFDYGAEVIVEAPAEIELESYEKMRIDYGRLFAHVPQRATGFTVDTPASKVIDIGTDFGIEVGFTGKTDVHMFKGKASLVAGRKGEKKQGIELLAGQAKAVIETGQVRSIRFKEKAFVRKLDSKTNLLWRGEALNLADIVGGGDGFGTGVLNEGVDIASGQACRELGNEFGIAGANQYVPVPDSRFIDGVFVVNNREKQVLINSKGHYFDPGYITEGSYWGYIVNGAFHQGRDVQRHTLVLDGQHCGTQQNPAIGIHSNMGITFDLDEIRNQIPQIVIDKFSAAAGVSETVANAADDHRGKVDFWVLLDGEVKFSKRVHYQDGSSLVDVPVSPDNRFLTLVVTDAGDRDDISYDWAMFVNPVLELR